MSLRGDDSANSTASRYLHLTDEFVKTVQSLHLKWLEEILQWVRFSMLTDRSLHGPQSIAVSSICEKDGPCLSVTLLRENDDYRLDLSFNSMQLFTPGLYVCQERRFAPHKEVHGGRELYFRKW